MTGNHFHPEIVERVVELMRHARKEAHPTS
jgi:hypothetical protein